MPLKNIDYIVDEAAHFASVRCGDRANVRQRDGSDVSLKE
jgi:hypothetical protein